MNVSCVEISIMRHVHILRRRAPRVANDYHMRIDDAWLWLCLQMELANVTIENDEAWTALEEAIDQCTGNKQNDAYADLGE